MSELLQNKLVIKAVFLEKLAPVCGSGGLLGKDGSKEPRIVALKSEEMTISVKEEKQDE